MTKQQIPQIEKKEIELVSSVLASNSVFSTPIFTKTPDAPPDALGRSRGTLTLVESERRVFAATAGHVVRDNIRNLAFSPIGPGWTAVKLNRFDWRYITAYEDRWTPEIDIDLAIAELSIDECKSIDSSRIVLMEPASLYDHPFVAFANGYQNKRHTSHALRSRGHAFTTSFGLVCDGLIPIIRPPQTVPDLPIHFTVPFDRKRVPYWRGRKKVNNIDVAPQPNGLSGGPLVFCGFRNPRFPFIRKPVVIGFLIEQSDFSKSLTFVASDVIYQSVNPY